MAARRAACSGSNVAGRGSVVGAARRLCTIDPRTPLDDVEVELENALLAENEFGYRNECKFHALAEDGAAGAEEQVLYELLRNCGRSPHAAAVHIVFGGDLDLVPIEPMVQVEAGVLRGDDSVLEIRRYLAERNEPVAFVIGRVVNPGLHAALDVHRGCRRVDPPGGKKGEHGKRPKKSETQAEQENEGSKKTAFALGLWYAGLVVQARFRIIAEAGCAMDERNDAVNPGVRPHPGRMKRLRKARCFQHSCRDEAAS